MIVSQVRWVTELCQDIDHGLAGHKHGSPTYQVRYATDEKLELG